MPRLEPNCCLERRLPIPLFPVRIRVMLSRVNSDWPAAKSGPYGAGCVGKVLDMSVGAVRKARKLTFKLAVLRPKIKFRYGHLKRLGREYQGEKYVVIPRHLSNHTRPAWLESTSRSVRKIDLHRSARDRRRGSASVIMLLSS